MKNIAEMEIFSKKGLRQLSLQGELVQTKENEFKAQAYEEIRKMIEYNLDLTRNFSIELFNQDPMINPIKLQVLKTEKEIKEDSEKRME